MVAAVIAGCATASIIGPSWSPLSWVIVASIPPLVWAAWVDAHTFRLPNRLTCAAAVPPFAYAVFALATAQPGSALQVFAGMAALVVPLGAVHLVSPEAMGMGDVKVCVGLGGCIGLIDPRLAPLALALASLLTAAVGIATRTRVLPFGPGLVGGALITLTVAAATSMEAQKW